MIHDIYHRFCELLLHQNYYVISLTLDVGAFVSDIHQPPCLQRRGEKMPPFRQPLLAVAARVSLSRKVALIIRELSSAPIHLQMVGVVSRSVLALATTS